MKNLDILNSIDLSSEYKTVLQRYYTPMYQVKIANQDIEHQCILFHTNRICLVTIAPTHPIIAQNKTIRKINYVDNNIDRLQNKVSGKGKRGGQKLEEKSILCKVETDDGCSYNIYSCVKGKLIEINKNLLNNPNLLITKYNTIGHVAIVLTDLSTIESTKNNMLSQDEYNTSIIKIEG